MNVGWLCGAFVVWRGKDDERICDWGIYQLDESGHVPSDVHVHDCKAEIVCKARVPISTSDGSNEVLQRDIDIAVEALKNDVVHQVRTRADLVHIREQFAMMPERHST